MTPEQAAYIRSLGQNPDEYEVVNNEYAIYKGGSAPSQPTNTPTTEVSAQLEDQYTKIGTAARGVAEGVLPTTAGAMAFGLLSKAAPKLMGKGLWGTAAGIGAGLVGAAGTRYLQDKALESVAPEVYQANRAAQAEHPYAYLGGNIASGLGPFSAGGSLANIRRTGSLLSKVFHGNAPLAIEKSAGANVGLGLGLGAGLEAGGQIAAGQELDPKAIALSAVGNALINEPRRFMTKFGLTPTSSVGEPQTSAETMAATGNKGKRVAADTILSKPKTELEDNLALLRDVIEEERGHAINRVAPQQKPIEPPKPAPIGEEAGVVSTVKSKTVEAKPGESEQDLLRRRMERYQEVEQPAPKPLDVEIERLTKELEDARAKSAQVANLKSQIESEVLNATGKQSPTEMDVRQQTGYGEEMGQREQGITKEPAGENIEQGTPKVEEPAKPEINLLYGVPDLEAQRAATLKATGRKPSQSFVDSTKAWAKEWRNTTVKVADQVLSPKSGKPLAGKIDTSMQGGKFDSEFQPTAEISATGATTDTPLHEVFHEHLIRMLNSPSNMDRSLASKAAEQVANTKLFKAYVASKGKQYSGKALGQGADGTVTIDPVLDEYITQRTGEQSVNSLFTEKPSWFKDFWAHLKTRAGSASDEQLMRLYGNKFLRDAPYSETFGGQVKGRAVVDADTIKEQPSESPLSAIKAYLKEGTPLPQDVQESMARDEAARVKRVAEYESQRRANAGKAYMDEAFGPGREQEIEQQPASLADTRFLTTTEKEFSTERPFGVSADKQGLFDSKQLKGKITALSKAEQELLSGLVEKLDNNPKVSAKAVKDWFAKEGPKVEVHTYGQEGKVSKAREEFNRMTHEWFDNLNIAEERQFADLAAGNLTEEHLKALGWNDEGLGKAREFIKLGEAIDKEPESTSPRATSYYNSISPKPTSTHPVTRVDVVIPQKKVPWTMDVARTMMDEFNPPRRGENMATERAKWQPDNLHENLPNTFGWAAIQYETLPSGEKVAHIYELQSRWAQEARNRGSRSMDELHAAGARDLEALDDPRLADWQRMVLKAAIDEARKNGATKIALSDAETAMLTEMHDQNASSNFIIEPSERNIRVAIEHSDTEIGNALENGQNFSVDIAAITSLERKGYKIGIGQKVISQEAGMRLNYDKIGPKILSELTGQEGQVVDFGPHKNALGDNYGNTGHNYTGTQVRKDLIFRNPDGTPKTSVTARVYDIMAPAKRLESGEPLSMFGKRYQEIEQLAVQDEVDSHISAEPPTTEGSSLRTLFHSIVGSATDKISAKYGKEGKVAAKAIKQMRDEATYLNGQYTNRLILTAQKLLKTPWEKWTQTSESLNKVYDHLQVERDNVKVTDEGLSPEEAAVKNELREILKQMAEDQIADGPNVMYYDKEAKDFVTRERGIDESYVPHVTAPEVLDVIRNNKPGASELKQDFIDWKVEREGMDIKDAHDLFNKILGRTKQSGNSVSLEFSGVRLPEGAGLPPSWRDKSFIRALQRYGRRFSSDLAFYRNLQKDPTVRRILSIESDGKLPKAAAPFEWEGGEQINQLDSTDEVQFIFRQIKNDYPVNDARVDSANRVIKSLMMQTPTGVRDLVASPFIAMEGMKVSELPLIAKAFLEIKDGVAKGYEQGVIRPGTTSWEDFATSPSTAFADNLATSINKITQRERLEQWSRGFSVKLGELIAESRLRAGDNAFFERYGPKDWQNKDKSFVTEWAGARYAEGVQGTYDYTGLPQWQLEGKLSPFFSLAKWSTERLNNFDKNVLAPARDGNFKPLLMATIGAAVGGTAIDELNNFINQKKPEHLTHSEWMGLDGKDSLYRWAALSSYSGYAGLLTDMTKSTLDVAMNSDARGFTFPLVQAVSGVVDRIGQASEAIKEGEKSESVIPDLLLQLAKDNVQLARTANNLVLKSAKDKKRQEAFRDLRVFERVEEGKLPGKRPETNPFLNKPYREFKQAEPGEDIKFKQALAHAMDKSKVGGTVDPYRLTAELNNLRRNQYRTMPSMEDSPLEFRRYLSFLERTQGKEAAVARLVDFLKQKEFNKAKTSLVPSL